MIKDCIRYGFAILGLASVLANLLAKIVHISSYINYLHIFQIFIALVTEALLGSIKALLSSFYYFVYKPIANLNVKVILMISAFFLTSCI